MPSGAALLTALPTHDGQQTAIALWQMTGVYLRRGPQVMESYITAYPSIEIISVRWTVQRICKPRGKREGGLTARYDQTVQQSCEYQLGKILLEIRHDR